jgi:hypothetical protein
LWDIKPWGDDRRTDQGQTVYGSQLLSCIRGRVDLKMFVGINRIT